MRCSRSESKAQRRERTRKICAHGRARPCHRPPSRGALGRHAPARRRGARARDESGIPAARRAAVGARRADARASCRTRSKRSGAKKSKTVVLVTNDVDEALLLADRIIPLTPGPRATLGPRVPRESAAAARSQGREPRCRSIASCAPRSRSTCWTSKQKSRCQRESAVKLPDVVPITSADFLPKAVRAANKPKPLSNPDKYVEFYNVHKVYPTPQGPADRGRGLSARHQARRVHFADRPFGLRQVHGAVDGAPDSPMCPTAASRSMAAKSSARVPIAAWCSRRRTCCPGSRRGRTWRSAWIACIRTPAARSAPTSSTTTSRASGLGDSLDKLARDLSNGMKPARRPGARVRAVAQAAAAR